MLLNISFHFVYYYNLSLAALEAKAAFPAKAKMADKPVTGVTSGNGGGLLLLLPVRLRQWLGEGVRIRAVPYA